MVQVSRCNSIHHIVWFASVLCLCAFRDTVLRFIRTLSVQIVTETKYFVICKPREVAGWLLILLILLLLLIVLIVLLVLLFFNIVVSLVCIVFLLILFIILLIRPLLTIYV